MCVVVVVVVVVVCVCGGVVVVVVVVLVVVVCVCGGVVVVVVVVVVCAVGWWWWCCVCAVGAGGQLSHLLHRVRDRRAPRLRPPDQPRVLHGGVGGGARRHRHPRVSTAPPASATNARACHARRAQPRRPRASARPSAGSRRRRGRPPRRRRGRPWGGSRPPYPRRSAPRHPPPPRVEQPHRLHRQRQAAPRLLPPRAGAQRLGEGWRRRRSRWGHREDHRREDHRQAMTAAAGSHSSRQRCVSASGPCFAGFARSLFGRDKGHRRKNSMGGGGGLKFAFHSTHSVLYQKKGTLLVPRNQQRSLSQVGRRRYIYSRPHVRRRSGVSAQRVLSSCR